MRGIKGAAPFARGGSVILKGLACCMLAGLLLASFAGCHNGQVRLQRAPDANGYVWRYPITAQESDAFWQGLLYVVEPQVGYAPGRQQKVEGFIVNAQVRWNEAVRPLGGLFEELRQQHNGAMTTLSEFEARKAQLVAAASALTAKRPQIDAAIAGYRDAWDMEAKYRGAQGPEAAAQVAQARQLMDAASQTIESIIQEATTLVESLKGKRAEAKVMAGQ